MPFLLPNQQRQSTEGNKNMQTYSSQYFSPLPRGKKQQLNVTTACQYHQQFVAWTETSLVRRPNIIDLWQKYALKKTHCKTFNVCIQLFVSVHTHITVATNKVVLANCSETSHHRKWCLATTDIYMANDKQCSISLADQAKKRMQPLRAEQDFPCPLNINPACKSKVKYTLICIAQRRRNL